MESKELYCKSSNLKANILLPASKSISNRLLIIKSLCDKAFTIEGLSNANDTALMQQLLLTIEQNTTQNEIILDAQDAGTVLRFLTAYCSIKEGNFLLTGSERMQERPIAILVDGLRSLGASIEYVKEEGFPPLSIKGKKLKSVALDINPTVSSQFISALLLIAPTLEDGLQIRFNGKPNSFPYIEMTLKLMMAYGIKLEYDENSINIQAGKYKAQNSTVESDWSSAAFFYQSLAFANKGQLFLEGLHLDSIQGDAVVAKLFEQLGIKTTEKSNGILIEKAGSINYNVNIDFSSIPDLALPVIATCAGLGIIGKFSGLASLKIKESNRIKALEVELAKLGFDFRETDENEWVLINSCKPDNKENDFRDITIDTYKDHRIAMSFAPFAILGKGININDPKVVTKSFPSFWKEFNKLLS